MIPRIEFEPDAGAPLDGIRVVDLSRLVAGNMLSLQLADHGAEVIKVEDPRTGDPLRAWRVNGLSLHWKVYARNKKSVALNLRQEAGRNVLCDLLEASDVLIENYRPGTLEAMGLSPAFLHARNPRLTIVRITGFGQEGPYRDRPGFGTLVEAMSGFAAKNGFSDRPPVLPPLALADMVAGLYGAYAVMIALRVVERGGEGQVILCRCWIRSFPSLDPMRRSIVCQVQCHCAPAAVLSPPRPAMSMRPATAAILRSPPRFRRWRNVCFARSIGLT
jgi:crotonobetainyl-CoA:carnitine CoA-transferase CaiB-like acyl-CoA transferase